MIFCIPSRNRKVITVESLQLTKENAIIFVDSKEQKELYLKNNWNQSIPIIVTNKTGITPTRNFILNHLKGKEIVFLDDDIKGIYQLSLSGNTLNKLPVEEVYKFCKQAFQTCIKNNTKLWGVYMVKNNFFMSHSINPSGFCISTFSGVLPSDIRFDESLNLKEDYDFTLQHIVKYKKVVRYNFICVDAIHYTNKGGCQDYRNCSEESEAVNILLGKYPNLIRLNKKRKNEIIISIYKNKG